MGNAIGPLLGGLMGELFGLSSSFFLQAGLVMIASALIFVLIKESDDKLEVAGHGAIGERFLGIIMDHRRTFATAGLATVCLSVLRASRQVIIPLWGEQIGLGATAVGGVFSASNSIDMLLFYPTGSVMDRWGRKWVGIPCMVILGIGLMLIPLATTLQIFVAVAMLTGLGNGMGSGILMTLGADFSPSTNRAEFLGVWRLISDAGQLAGPLLLSAVTGFATLGLASVATGSVGLLGAAIMWIFMPEPLPKRRRRPSKCPTPHRCPPIAPDAQHLDARPRTAATRGCGCGGRTPRRGTSRRRSGRTGRRSPTAGRRTLTARRQRTSRTAPTGTA